MNDHSPLPVAGYTAQNSRAVQIVNVNKALEEQILRRLEDLPELDMNADRRHLENAREYIEIGFMLMNRAIFRPARVSLEQQQLDL